MRTFFFFFLFLISYALSASDSTKVAFAVRTNEPPHIDGIMEETWNSANNISDFIQYVPHYNSPPTQKTEVRIMYDDKAIYVFATMYDASPDSILKQLGNRDDEDLNADFFGIEFDTYNNQLDGYSFMVYASGVQADFREFDNTYNAVWESKTKITDIGWTAEFKIPYSALRFPTIDIQTWGMEIFRSIRRNRESDNWALQKKGVQNNMVYWGKLKGLENIQAPIRLSFYPYISSGLQTKDKEEGAGTDKSWSFAGGLDLKYGINESFTLDMTLLPDFSQVQSDNKVKNLSAFETVYNEQRPFFNEAVDLFSKGNLFYSRRIGRTPSEFENVENLLDSGETIQKNPSQSQLINATKVSGRNKNGLAIGFFNAVTNDTWAIINKTDGGTRRILTEPFANYNILVFDQALKNNSSIFISNSNFTRDKGFYNSDVTAGGFSFYDKTNTWYLSGGGGISQFYFRGKKPEGENLQPYGGKYSISIGKSNGNFQFSINHNLMDHHYNANDVGLTLYNNFINNNGSISYNIYEPFWKFRELYNSLFINDAYNYSTRDLSNLSLNWNTWGTLLNYLSIWFNGQLTLSDAYNYNEPRIEGRYFITKKTNGLSLGFSSDYRKPFALDGNFGIYETKGFNDYFKQAEISPLVRVSNHFSFRYTFDIYDQQNEKGFATLSQAEDSIIFGNRDVKTIVNTFSGNYIVKNDLSLSLRFRHYWAKGIYCQYYQLLTDGTLEELPSNIDYKQNFNFNSFNIDLVFSWQFAPGSNLSFVWKKEILSESDVIINSFSKNFTNTLDQLQSNTFSIKAIYYLDYLYLTNKK